MPTAPRRPVRKLLRRAWILACIGATVALVLIVSSVLVLRVQEATGPRLACLLYHRFVTDEEFSRLKGDDRLYAIPVGRFEEHLRFLQREGYYAANLSECSAFAKGDLSLPEKSVLITIDDGYRSMLTRAEPLLRKYGFRAILFVTASPDAYVFEKTGERRLTDQELASFDPRVIEIGAHGISHRPLSEMDYEELQGEMRGSRTLLAERICRPVSSMAVPGNHYDDRVMGFAQEAGYSAVFTSDPGSIQPGSDCMRLPRLNVAGHLGDAGLANLFSPTTIAVRRFTWACRHAPKKLFGAGIGAPIGDVLVRTFNGATLSARNALLASAAVAALWVVPLVRRVRVTQRAG